MSVERKMSRRDLLQNAITAGATFALSKSMYEMGQVYRDKREIDERVEDIKYWSNRTPAVTTDDAYEYKEEAYQEQDIPQREDSAFRFSVVSGAVLIANLAIHRTKPSDERPTPKSLEVQPR